MGFNKYNMGIFHTRWELVGDYNNNNIIIIINMGTMGI